MEFSSPKIKKFILFREIERSGPKIKKVLIQYFLKKNFSYILRNATFKKKLSEPKN